MKKADVKLGRRYMAKVSVVIVVARLDRESPFGWWNAENMKTMKTMTP